MAIEQTTALTHVSLKDIKEIGGAAGPCVSILMPVNLTPGQTAQNPVRLRHLVEKAEQLLEQRGTEKAVAKGIVAELQAAIDGVQWDSAGLAMFFAPGVSRVFAVTKPMEESVTVNGRFMVRPLIPLMDTDKPFYILALAQRHIRLLRCTQETSEEVELPNGMPKSLWEDKETDQPDHVQDNRSGAGPDVGGMKGVAFSTNTDSEDRPQYLAHFYKHVSEGVKALLREENAPLVIAGVEYETALFKRVNVYPHLVEEPVHGAADGLKGGELHRRALEAVKGYFDEPLKKAAERFEQGAAERVSAHVKDIVVAACDGRVMDLIVAEGARYTGVYREAKHEVKAHVAPGDEGEDLLNLAVLQTILHGGQVFVVPGSKVPHGAAAVAVFRY